MKRATIGDMLVGRHVDTLTLLCCAGFNLGKKVFTKNNEDGSKSYFQAECAQEDRFLRRSRLESFFLERAKSQPQVQGAEPVRAFR